MTLECIDKNEAKADAYGGEKESALRPTFCRSAAGDADLSLVPGHDGANSEA